MGFTINEVKWDGVNVKEQRKTAVGLSLSSFFSKTNSSDTQSESIPNWHSAYWQRVSVSPVCTDVTS